MLAAASALSLLASSSGLNNIPTTDTAGHRVLVFQDYPTFGARRVTDNFLAFKAGYDLWRARSSPLRIEWGLDGRTRPGDGAPLLQVKMSYQPSLSGPTLCVGTANVAPSSGGRARVGQPYSFAVVSQNVNVARLHGGYAVQANNSNSAILGIDRGFRLARRDLVLRADAIQVDRGTNWAASVGGVYVFAKHMAVEAWVTQAAHGRPPAFTVKLDFISGF